MATQEIEITNLIEGPRPPEEEKPPKPTSLDYKYLDGLRGIGAFIVYIVHTEGSIDRHRMNTP